jgi:2,3-bisphosphoglycerate-independent phosphoglycerate mutase
MINQETISTLLSIILLCVLVVQLCFQLRKRNKSEIPPYRSSQSRINALEILTRSASLANDLPTEKERSMFKECIASEIDLIKSGQQSKR